MRPCKVSKSPQWLTKISRASCATIGDADLKLIDLRASVRRPDNCLCCDFDHQARTRLALLGSTWNCEWDWIQFGQAVWLNRRSRTASRTGSGVGFTAVEERSAVNKSGITVIPSLYKSAGGKRRAIAVVAEGAHHNGQSLLDYFRVHEEGSDSNCI